MAGDVSASETGIGEAATRCGFAAIIGAPNAGKSTLLNQLVGSKLSIVTQKVQTTRTRLRGIVIEGDAQIVCVDTPGIFTPRRSLDEAMVQAAWAGAADADTVLLIVDARFGLDDQAELVIAGLDKAGVKPVLVLNKIDLIRRDALLEMVKAFNARRPFAATFLVSALSGDGVADLKAHVAANMPPGPWLYPEDQVADVPLRLLAAEITREKIFLRLHEELPYASTVETESWKERKDGSVRVDQVIYVEREGQRKIVLGKNGHTIKTIGQAARTEIAELIGQPVHLFLFVKVRSSWASDPERLRTMGLELPRR
ncbi:MAG TPA: GTPase Era [Aestuariivirgaceae bacterium]|nr:GTPase Era [Aestuariivirgaceae bacterium]